MPDAKLTDAELADGLAKGEAAGWRSGSPRIGNQEAWEAVCSWKDWVDDHGETALRELAALREQLAAERVARERLEREHGLMSEAIDRYLELAGGSTDDWCDEGPEPRTCLKNNVGLCHWCQLDAARNGENWEDIEAAHADQLAALDKPEVA